MDNNKIICIETGSKTAPTTIVPGFTTNKNYLGHTLDLDAVPVYYSPFLKEGEIKKIMANEEMKFLPEGKYLAKVEQVIRKHGKDANGNEDTSKGIVSIELNVKGQSDRFYYISFCVEGYSEEQMKYAIDDMNEIIKEFKLSAIEDLAGKVVVLNVVKNAKGNTNYYIHEQKEYFDWRNYEGFKFTDTVKFPAKVVKIHPKDTDIYFIVKATVNNETIEECVKYDLTNKYAKESYDWVMKRLALNEDYFDTPVEKDAYLIVKKTAKDGKTYINKRLGFDKIQPKKPEKW